MKFSAVFASILILSSLFSPLPREILGCAAAPHPGERFRVEAEEAIILFDSQSKTEHFIRRAHFDTDASDFGFLVPTPTKPELSETDASAFSQLDGLTAARHVKSGKVREVKIKRDRDNRPSPKAAPPEAPRILEEKNVAGLDAVVLQADDVAGLKMWLEEHKYDARPALMNWLKWYVEHQWIITAFKLSHDHTSQRDRWNKSVRMTFHTETPFYPYREPEDMRSADKRSERKLRVFFLSDSRYEGTLGQSGRWPGKTVWANPCSAGSMFQLHQLLGTTLKPSQKTSLKSWFLTEFEDLSAPRPGTDEVYFKPAMDQSTLERPVIYYDEIKYVEEQAEATPIQLLDNIRLTAESDSVLPILGIAIAILTAIGYLVIRVYRMRSQIRASN